MPCRADSLNPRVIFHWIRIVLCLFHSTLFVHGNAKEEFFERWVRPILVESCYECHSQQAKRIGGNLRLDSRSAILTGGDLGPAVLLGKPDQSLLIQAIEHADEDLKMPKRKAALSTSKITVLRQWISDGLVWPGIEKPIGNQNPESSFDLAGRKSRLPWIWHRPEATPIPQVRSKNFTNWASDGLDRFVLARLQDNDLHPSTDADDSVWLRRVSQVITGLPPSLTLQESFAAKPKQLRYEFAVDRLLASPRYGERWARHWMDLVRYAESRGHESDFIIANAFHYRDYLIRAFNDDLPYDQFVREHLAGDLIPDPRTTSDGRGNESILGTGWAFLGEEVHSPVDIRQDECDRIDNKIDVLSKTFLGLTVACARCHDHKFDAISQKDYYSLSGFFLSSNFQQVRFESQLANNKVSERLNSLRSSFQPKFWKAVSLPPVDDNRGPLPSGLASTYRISAKSREIVNFSDDGLYGARLLGPALRFLPRGTWFLSHETPHLPSLTSDPVVMRDPSWSHLNLKAGNQADAGSLDATSRSNGMLKTKRFRLENGKLRYLISGSVKVYAAVDSHLMVAGPLHGALVKTFKASSGESQSWVTHDLSEYRGHLVHLEFGTIGDEPLSIYQVIESEKLPENEASQRSKVVHEEHPGIVSTSFSALKVNEFQINRLPLDQQRTAIALAVNILNNRSSGSHASITLIANQLREQERLELEHAQLGSLTAVVLSDNNGVNESILIRGSPKRPGTPAPRGLPSAFETAEVFDEKGSGRLRLANAIASSENPLTARVIVNRVWHHLFGRGIVPTVDNFGYLGERPSHPQLLDYLSHEFVTTNAWSLKQLIRRIVLSRTYRMSSDQHDPSASAKDPENQLLSRFPVRRLEAEAIRDNVLAVTGSLNSTMFGKSIPVHLTDFVVGRGRPGKSGPLDGQGRRSVYVAVRRNFLPTLMTAFDYPTPFSTIGKRNVTNVPAQSLALMNDEFVHEQAKLWAQRLLLSGQAGRSDLDRLNVAFLTAFCRLPTDAERKFCSEALTAFNEFHSDQNQPLNAWTDLCHSLLAMNEFVYIR